MKIAISVDTKRLIERLRKLPDDVQDKVIIKSVRDGANVIRNDAKRNAPVDSGFMKSKIKARKANKNSSLGNFVFIVKVDSPAHHLIELGTKERTSNKGRKLKFEGSNGQDIYVDKVAGIKANPFLGKAYENNKESVMEKFRQRILKEISKI